MARAIDKRIMLDLIIGANKTDPEAGPFSEWMAEYLVEHLATFDPPNKWVIVEERLPENNTQVLMWSARWKIAEAGSYYNKHFWVYSEIGDGYIADNITHWMPLPAPPDRRPPEGETHE